MLAPELCIARLAAESSESVVGALAQRLLAGHHVKATFQNAALARERRSPTGLPFPGEGVAMPHAEPEHVLSPAIAIASLATPVAFRQMGAPGVKVDVALVVMPALTAREQAAGELSRMIGALQDEAWRRALREAEDDASLYALFAQKLGGR